MVASDRISTDDVGHPTPIPDKGKVLSALSVFWFEQSADIVPNHLSADLRGRTRRSARPCLAVRKLEMLPVECVVRGYLTGSGSEGLCRDRRGVGDRAARGAARPSSCPSRSSRPRRRPTSATTRRSTSTAPRRSSGPGRHGAVRRDLSIALYSFAAQHAASRGVILADTKFEFGERRRRRAARRRRKGATPDSSRFWPADPYEVGRPQPSFDKQYVRDRAAVRGDKKPPAPAIPSDVVAGTRAVTSRPTRRSRASRSATGSPGWHRSARARALVRPKVGILDPQGVAVERALPALGFEGRRERPRRAAHRARRRGPVTACRDVRKSRP